MAKVFKNGQTSPNTKETGLKDKLMVKGDSLIATEMFT
jgi:hypothetical protein